MDGTSRLFAPLISELAQFFDLQTPVYPDQPGIGYTGLHQRWLQITQPAAKIDGNPYRHSSYILVAESYSTPLAIMAATSNPENLMGVVLCAGFCASPIHGWMGALLRTFASILFRLPLPEAAVRGFLLDSNSPSVLLRQVQDVIASVSPATLTSRLRDVLEVNVEALLDQVSVPLLWLVPAQDRLIPAQDLNRLRGRHPNLEILEIPGPHLLFQRHPTECAGAIRAFVSALDSSPNVTGSPP